MVVKLRVPLLSPFSCKLGSLAIINIRVSEEPRLRVNAPVYGSKH